MRLPTLHIMWRVLAPLWGPLPFVWAILVMGPRWCSTQPNCTYEAAVLLILSLMAMEYGWLQGRMLGLHDKLQGAGVSPLRLYNAHLGVWAGVLGLPCIGWMTYSYGWPVGLALVFFMLAPLTGLAIFLWHGGARLFHYLLVFIPLQLPYFLLLQGVVEQDQWTTPCMALGGAASVGLALMGLSLPSVPSIAACAWKYCFSGPEPASASSLDFCP